MKKVEGHRKEQEEILGIRDKCISLTEIMGLWEYAAAGHGKLYSFSIGSSWTDFCSDTF